MTARPGPTAAPGPVITTGSTSGSADALPDSADKAQRGARRLHRIGWHSRSIAVLSLLGCLVIFALMRSVAGSLFIDASWSPGAQALPELAATSEPALTPLIGRTLVSLTDADARPVQLDHLVLHRSPRWVVDDETRRNLVRAQVGLARALERGPVAMTFDNGQHVVVTPRTRGYAGLGALFWLMSALALLLYLAGAIVLLAQPEARNAAYLVATLCQAGNLLSIAVESAPGTGVMAGLAERDMLLRVGFDLLTVGAIVLASTQSPRRVPGDQWICALTGVLVVLLLALAGADLLPHLWWWAQGGIVFLGLVSIGVLSWSYRIEPNPFAAVMRRISIVALSTFVLFTGAVAAGRLQPTLQYSVASIGSVIWYLFFASLLLLVPFLSRTKQILREFTMLAGVSTVATSLDLLFVAVFSLGQFTSLTLAVFLSLGAYAGARQWLLNQMLGSSMLTAERMFEQLYRTARDVKMQPQQRDELLSRLLRDLFEPLELTRVDRRSAQTRVVGEGSALLVPVPRALGGDEADGGTDGSLLLRFARRGKRMFTADDARLTDRIVDQLRQAVAYDQAVERGRNEERLRIAQDLHDDIGARLLTLMYKTQNPELEDYIRQTLKDLKTLTRGLAASEHRLSHAAAEWKADISQRLTAAQVDVDWSFSFDRDVRLSVVQWSALTRVLRELVSNAIYHAQATRVGVAITFEQGALSLAVCDDGIGSDPASWSHGLGLGGVRKRVKQLGGDVHWNANAPCGIVCEVSIPELMPRD